MNTLPTTDSLVCRKHRREIAVPGGAIFENTLICISHALLWGNEQDHYLGHLFVEPKRHLPEWGELTEQEARLIGLYTGRVRSYLNLHYNQ